MSAVIPHMRSHMIPHDHECLQSQCTENPRHRHQTPFLFRVQRRNENTYQNFSYTDLYNLNLNFLKRATRGLSDDEEENKLIELTLRDPPNHESVIQIAGSHAPPPPPPTPSKWLLSIKDSTYSSFLESSRLAQSIRTIKNPSQHWWTFLINQNGSNFPFRHIPSPTSSRYKSLNETKWGFPKPFWRDDYRKYVPRQTFNTTPNIDKSRRVGVGKRPDFMNRF